MYQRQMTTEFYEFFGKISQHSSISHQSSSIDVAPILACYLEDMLITAHHQTRNNWHLNNI